MKLHEILVMVLMLALFSTGFLLFINEGVSQYAPSSAANTTYLTKVNATSAELIDLSEGIKANMTELESGGGLLDSLAQYYYIAVASTKATWIGVKSTGQLATVAQDTVDVLPSSPFNAVLTPILLASLLITFIIGIVLYTWTKSERL